MAPYKVADEKGPNAAIVAEFVENTQFCDLPGEVVQMAKRCLLDFLGVALASRDIPAVESGLDLLRAMGVSPDATIIGCNRRAPVLGAVWANAMLGSALDFEDGYYPSVGHPASVVFPVTLALAEREGRSPEEFLTASVIGYEVCARAGMLMTRTYREKPRGSGGSSVYGAAAAAGRLLSLGQKEIMGALGIAGAYMTAVPVLKSHANEAMVKGGIPWGAFTGAASAFLARGGFTGPPATLEDPSCSEYEEDARDVLKSLGHTYEISNVYFKRYPSCRWTHAALDATAVILREHKVDIENISSISVETFREATTLDARRPASLEGVQFSIPFTLALLLSEGEFGVRQMTLANLKNPSVRAMADKVELSVDPVLDRLFPRNRPARVTITTGMGNSFSGEIIEVHGEPGSQFAVEGIRGKFLNLASERLGEAFANKIYQTVSVMESFSSLKPLMDLLS